MQTISFDKVRPLFGGKLTQGQVDGINSILSGWNKYAGPGVVNNRQILAYVLATAKWESAHTMQPVKETGTANNPWPSDATVISRLDKAFEAGKLKGVKTQYWRDGWFGRGLVQLTHESNYKGAVRTAVLKEFGADIHARPGEVLRSDISVFILIRGMLEGWFTNLSVDEFIDALDEDDKEDLREYTMSRRVINGTDRAADIASLALAFETALSVVPVQAQKPRNIDDWLKSIFRRDAKVTDDVKPGQTVVTSVESGWTSKINWTQAITVIATILALFGIPLPPEVQVAVVAVIQGAGALITWVLNTFFETKIVASAAKKA